MKNIDYLKQFISNFIIASGNKNANSLLESLADEMDKLQKVSIDVTDQLTISTASSIYLDKRLAEVGITRPPDIGMDDVAFRKMGIQIDSARQITKSIHDVLSTFYGDDSVRANLTCKIPAPYDIEEGDDLIFELEDGEKRIFTVDISVFENPSQTKAEEIVDSLTRFIRNLGYDGYSQIVLNTSTNEKFVRIYGAAKGPYGSVKILGGKLQTKLEFPTMRATELAANDTVWEITRNVGNTYRFRWTSGSQPLLSKIFVGDSVLLYGSQFENYGFNGTFLIKKVRPASPSPAYNSGYFEIDIDGLQVLKSSTPDIAPPMNTLTEIYQITVTQADYDDLKFFVAKKSTPYSQLRYALAWEAENAKLKIYLPAVTQVVKRDLEGASHIHNLYEKDDFNGSFGSSSVEESKIIVTSDLSFKYKQSGYDSYAIGGTVSVGLTQIEIDYIFRESGFVNVITKTPHNITGVADAWGQLKSTEIVSVSTIVDQDDLDNKFLGPYIIDLSTQYTLTDKYVFSREKIFAGESKQTLKVQGVMPNETGLLMFGLNKDEEETGIRYYASQASSSVTPIGVSTISQFGTTVTVTTAAPHGLIPNQQFLISGTINFNGVWSVLSIPSSATFTFNKTSATLYESAGSVTPIVDGIISTLILDGSYVFKHTHEINEDITLISSNRAYEPKLNGLDYGFYITGVAEARVFAEQLIRDILALGVKLELIIVYPNDIGLGNEGGSSGDSIPVSEKTYVWGV
jgi:hypothetical protein